MDQMCLTAEPHESPHSPSLALFLLPSRPAIAGTLGVVATGNRCGHLGELFRSVS